MPNYFFKNKYLAVVDGLEINGLGIVRELGRQNVNTIAVEENPNAYGLATKYCNKVYHPKEGLIKTLCEIGESISEKGILILTKDQSVLQVSKHREKIEKYFIHSLPEDTVIQKLMSKIETQNYAKNNGLKISNTIEMNGTSKFDIFYNNNNALSFPFILKPNIKTTNFLENTPQKAFFIRNIEEFKRMYPTISRLGKQFVIQEWIPGKDTNLIFCLYYFNQNSEPLACFTGRKIRQFIPYCGTGCFVEPWDDPYVRDEGIRFFQGINYRGFGAIEFKIDERNGLYYLIEPTVGRTEHLFVLASANGINLSYIGYCDMAGLPVPLYKNRTLRIKYLYWRRDLRAAKYYIKMGELTFWEWLKSLYGKKQYALFALDDLRPITNKIKTNILGKIRKIFRIIIKLTNKFLIWIKGMIFPQYFHTNLLLIKDFLKIKQPVLESNYHIQVSLEWLKQAQDATNDKGVARGYCLRDNGCWQVGWQASYPETTGYIITTMFDCYEKFNYEELKMRAIEMADWECAIQLPDGGVQGGLVGEANPPVVFNTGQVIFGWCRTYSETNNKKYLLSAKKAAQFLCRVQEKDGAWRRYINVKGSEMEHAKDVRAAWALLEVYKLTFNEKYKTASIHNIEYTLKLQKENGWFKNNCILEKYFDSPLLHAIAYTMEGIFESGIYLNNWDYIEKIQKTANALIQLQKKDGSLPGRIDANWQPAASYCCLTGLAQTSVVWLKFFRITGDSRYLEAAKKANFFLKSTQNNYSKNSGIKGGIKGSYPIYGKYGTYQYLNWAVKFFIDALLLEMEFENSLSGLSTVKNVK